MFKYIFLFLSLFLISCKINSTSENAILVIHGGAGTILKENMTDSLEMAYTNKLKEALLVGQKVLNEGGSSVEAVAQTIEVLENSPLFNAGKGAVFTNEGENELDASIMNGGTGQAGAVAGVHTLKNPIRAAIAVMEQSEHVMLVGEGAEKFAVNTGVEQVDPAYFFTTRRFNQHLRSKITASPTYSDNKFGTVGAVALDQQGHLAAGTSTGGMTNKRFGRVGDAPIIGAGTYADQNCGISATGHGEFFIRNVVAYDIAAQMAYLNKSLKDAAHHTIHNKLTPIEGFGGVVCLDKNGNVSMPFNTEGMYRGFITKTGEPQVFIYKD